MSITKKALLVLLTISDRNNYSAKIAKETKMAKSQIYETLKDFKKLEIVRVIHTNNKRIYFELTDKGKKIQEILMVIKYVTLIK